MARPARPVPASHGWPEFEYSLSRYVDDITNAADELYIGWPERLYAIAAEGGVAYKGKPGPFGHEPDEVEVWLAERCER